MLQLMATKHTQLEMSSSYKDTGIEIQAYYLILCIINMISDEINQVFAFIHFTFLNRSNGVPVAVEPLSFSWNISEYSTSKSAYI